MKYEPSPVIERHLLENVREIYMGTDRTGIHLSSISYCLTKAAFESDPSTKLPLSDKELKLFAIGFALEDVFLRPGTNHEPPETIIVDGISMSPDYVIAAEDIPYIHGEGVDLKSTRMRPDASGVPTNGWPEGWLKQFMSYARAKGQTTWTVAIMYIIPPEFTAGTFTFTEQELEANWANVIERYHDYLDFVATGKIPQPYKHLGFVGECKDCRYKMKCFALTGANGPGA